MCLFKKENLIFPHPPLYLCKQKVVIIEDVEPTFSCNFDFISVLEGYEFVLPFNELRKRASSPKYSANLGIYDAEHLLLEHQKDIPTTLHNNQILFPGTIVHMDGFSPRIPFIYWWKGGGRWNLGYIDLNTPWFRENVLARCK